MKTCVVYYLELRIIEGIYFSCWQKFRSVRDRSVGLISELFPTLEAWPQTIATRVELFLLRAWRMPIATHIYYINTPPKVRIEKKNIYMLYYYVCTVLYWFGRLWLHGNIATRDEVNVLMIMSCNCSRKDATSPCRTQRNPKSKRPK